MRRMKRYILGIDQSTQGTKALLFDESGKLCARADKPHRQIVNEKGWVGHDLEEIYRNTIQTVKNVTEKAAVNPDQIAGVGISNQRETTAVFDETGRPICHAIVWQCSRAEDICARVRASGADSYIQKTTGIRLSPYFPAAKLTWFFENVPEVKEKAASGSLRLGTVDTYLVYRLTGGRVYRTDCSNASRTQLLNLSSMTWDSELCKIFGIDPRLLPEVTDSDGDFGETDFEGFLPYSVPIHGVLGDSHAALFGQGCLSPGMIKTTYGTGSSVMMNIGERPVLSRHGVTTSVAWRMGSRTVYCLEGNINYSGAVITWLKDDMKLIRSAQETENLARLANPEDHSCLVPAFTGLGAPYWNSKARAVLCNMSRTTRRAEIVRDALQCIAYQVTDIVKAMEEDTGFLVSQLSADGGAAKNGWLMQFQSDMIQAPVLVPPLEELSGMGAACAAGCGLGFWDTETLFRDIPRKKYSPRLAASQADGLYREWKKAVDLSLAYSSMSLK